MSGRTGCSGDAFMRRGRDPRGAEARLRKGALGGDRGKDAQCGDLKPPPPWLRR
ncbi:hypothetical protein FA13DRAFT_309250 [Coprinellus micaceus]|uniref:Uncharacterized protein n=1 Tax=Coprinellus micaceus TaxID=71717 RepID=A0A4Y7TE58_COPMI|nr:hypothetical protein FA13DRAFT_309250 [Coprinellus micaceus]